jgi:hypothetical protein
MQGGKLLLITLKLKEFFTVDNGTTPPPPNATPAPGDAKEMPER